MLTRVPVSDLRIGMHVHELCGSWLEHPFWRRSFTIDSAAVLAKLKASRVEAAWVDSSRSVLVQFDANLHDLPWRFQPLQRSIEVHPGQFVQIEYEVLNNRDVPVTGQAVPSYGPQVAARYFNKMECFCFEQQTLAPGERRIMPVVFVLDPALPRDVSVITLSYTFFELPGRNTAVLTDARLGQQAGSQAPTPARGAGAT